MEKRVANIILGKLEPGDSFTLKYGIFRFKLSIRPLTLKQVIEISKEVCSIPELNLNAKDNIFNVLMKNAVYLENIARIIAIATGHKLPSLIYKAVLGLPLKDVYTLFNIVDKQSDPQPFFFIMSKTEKINILKKPAK